MKKLLTLLIGMCLAFILSCGDDSGTDKTESYVLDDVMPDELFDALGDLPDAEFTIDDVILPNGLKYPDFMRLYQQLSKVRAEGYNAGEANEKNNLIGQLLKRAIFLTERDNFVYPNEGTNKPTQYGLAYVWGGKEIRFRNKVSDGSNCSDILYGLDCSGYIYQIFKHNGLNLQEGSANDQRKTTVLEKAIKSKFPNVKLNVEDLGQIPLDECESGDVICWLNENRTRAYHIGMLADTGDGLFLVHSRGGPDKCDLNKTEEGGPIKKKLGINYKLTTMGKYYGIVRINVADAWTLRLRCAGENYDILSTELSIPQNKSFSDEISVICADYDGEALSSVIKLQYNKNNNMLDLAIVSSNGSSAKRTDFAKIKLDKDDTDYIDLQNESFSNSTGCVAQVRLIKGSQSNSKQLNEASLQRGMVQTEKMLEH